MRALYDERLAAVPGVMVVGEDEQSQSVLWMYAIRLDPAFGWTRDELRRQLARRGIETRTFFIPLHWQPIYFDQFRDERFPVSEMLCEAGLYLPTNEALSPDEVNWICDQIAEIQVNRSEAIRAAE